MKKITFLLLLTSMFTTSFAQLTGTKNIPGDYASLAAAITDLNTQGVGAGGVTLNLLASNAQTAPAGGYSLTAIGTVANPIVLTGNSNTITAFGGQTAGSLNDAIFKLIGADYVTIQGFTMQENAANTTTAVATNNMTEFGVALLYASLTNGAQYNTIQNNTISLLRTNINSFGIYSNTRHAANGILNATTVTAEVTSAAGSNSFNKVYGNSISNVNFGIVFSGAGTTLAAIDNGNDIGGTSAATGNSITNWGMGAATASTFTSLTGNNYSIFSNQQINDNISFNTITSAALTSAASEGGILKNYSVATPISGTITTTINNNTVTITNNPTATTTGGIIGVNNQGLTTFLSTATMSMNNNIVQNCVLGGSTSTTNGISAITNLSLPGTLNITGNSVINNAITATTATTGSNIAIQNGAAAGTVNMNNNIVYNQKSSATTSGQIQGLLNLGVVVTALNMNNNQLGNATGGFCTMTAANTGGALFGVCNQAGAATCVTTIQNNDIRGITYNVATNAAQTYFQNSAIVASCLISSNTLTNLNVNTTGNIYFVSIAYTAVATATKTVTNNSIVTGFNRGGASGTTYFVYDNGSSVAGCVSNCTNNNFSNVTVSGTAIITGLSYLDGGTAPTRTVTGNVFNNITAATGAINLMNFTYWNGASSLSNNTITNVTGQGAVTGITIGSTANSASSITVSGNIVNNLSSTGTGGAVTGLSCTNTSTLINITGNKINTLSSTGASAVTGISIGGATTTNVYKNKIGDLSGSNASSTVNGILVSTGTTVNLYNNLVGDLRTPIANAANPVNGISITGGTAVNAYFNTVNIAGTSSGALFGTSAVSVSTTPAVTLRNNIFVNGSTPVGATGFAAAYRRSSTTLTSYAAASNNNLFYAGRPGTNNVIYYDGTNTDQTMVSFKARVNSRDNSSVTENPSFVSTAVGNASFLHIDPATPTQIESGAVAIATITDDYDGDARSATNPDMGADEGSFIMADIIGPGITYTNFTNTACSNDRTLASVAISDASGVNATAGTRPRLYYKKSGNADTYVDNTNATDGWKYVEAGGSGGTPFSFATNFALLFGGTPVLNDVIQYFIVSQDLAATPNVGINNGTFTAVPTDVALTAAAFPITGTNSFTIISGGLVGTVNVGAAETYHSLTEAGAAGLFNIINTGGISGSLTVNIMDASITETGATALNAIAYNGCASGPYNVLIKPNVASTLTGSVGTGAVIKLNGADYVTIDGSTSGSSDRSLTIKNSTTTTSGNAVIWLASPATGNGAIYNTIKNCNIEGNAATTTFAGMYIGGNTTISVTAAGSELNSNNTITNNLFRKSQYGVALFGYAIGAPDLNNSITNNNFGTAVAGEGFSLLAINADRQNGLVVSGNEVQNVVNANTTSLFGGMRLLDFKNGQCFNNKIHDLSYTGTSTPKIYGIAVSNTNYTTSGNPSQSLLYNNSVSNITSTGTSTTWNLTGILAGVGYGDKYYHNTVNLNGQLANSASGLAAAFAIGDANVTGFPTNVDVRNNIFSISGSSATAGGNFWALYSTATTLVGSVVNYNDYNINSTNVTNNIGRFNSINYTTLGTWQTATSQDANSITYAPIFVSNTDLHLVPGLNVPGLNGPIDNQGTPIAAVTADIDGDTRSVTTPDLGVDEFVVPICVTAVGGTGAGSTSACVTYAGTITATGYSTGIGTTYKWLSASSINGPWNEIAGASTPGSYTITPAVTATTYYRLAVTCATNSSNDSSSVVTITINAKPTVPVSPAGPIALCAPATQTLDASATNAASTIVFQWLNAGAAIAGANSATYVASASGTYRARVQDGITGCFDTSVVVNVIINSQPSAITITPAGPTICAGNIQLLTASGGTLSGTQQLGTSAGQSTASSTVAALGPNPFQSYYGGTKQQMIVTAAELSGLGMASGSVLSALAFQVGAVESRTFQGFVVKISNTSLSSFASTTFEPAGTVVRNAANYTPAVGWNTLTFDNNFTWNGTSNLLIETNCSNNDGGGSATNTAHYMTTADATTLFYRVDNVSAATMDAATTANYSISRRNIMRFTFSTPMSTIWSSATNLYSNAGATTAYTGAFASSVYFKGTTTTYTVSATSPAGCSNSTNVTVTTTGVTASTAIAGVASAGATTMESNSYNVNGVTDYLNSCKVISTITPGGASAVTGNITNSVRIDTGATKMGTARLYAARFYDVNPATNPASATGTVKLYFLQTEFDNYNLKAADSGFTPLPLAGGGNTDSLRILVYHGSPTGGYFPGNYSGTIEELSTTTPGVSVVWNAAGNNGTGWWEISFPANGFSGYFISSKPATVLPIRVEYFRGTKQTSSHILDWKVTPVNTANGTITLERSNDSRNFKAIYSITATSLRMLLPFSYTNLNPAAGMNYYRLKLVDDNGIVSYSSMVALMNAVKGVEFVNVTPNPVTDGRFKLNVSAAEQVKMDIVITDLAGRVMMKQAASLIAGFNAIEMSVKNLSAGVYQIVGYTADGKTRVLQFVKQ